MDDEARFTAKDANELAGLSYRQLNDWEAKGAAPADRDGEGGWRKFSPKQIFALMVCNEIRRLYGTPLEKLRFVSRFMMQDEANHLAAAIRLMKHGLHVFLLTDLEETFVMDSDLEFADYMRHGYFRVEETRPYIFLRLNEVVNRLLAATTEPAPLKPHGGAYRVKNSVDAAITVHTAAEFELLQAVRSGRFDRVEVKLKGGLIRSLDAEGDIESGDLGLEDEAVTVARKGEFENITIKARDGQIVNARRTVPRKYSDEDNKPTIFAGISNPEAAPSGQSRDGEQPSDVTTTPTPARRDRQPLSRENQAHKRARVPDAQPRKMPTATRR